MPMKNDIDEETAAWEYPDGWTCQECGEEFDKTMPTKSNGATICLKCVEEGGDF